MRGFQRWYHGRENYIKVVVVVQIGLAVVVAIHVGGR
jgi:hypothetical protein